MPCQVPPYAMPMKCFLRPSLLIILPCSVVLTLCERLLVLPVVQIYPISSISRVPFPSVRARTTIPPIHQPYIRIEAKPPLPPQLSQKLPSTIPPTSLPPTNHTSNSTRIHSPESALAFRFTPPRRGMFFDNHYFIAWILKL